MSRRTASALRAFLRWGAIGSLLLGVGAEATVSASPAAPADSQALSPLTLFSRMEAAQRDLHSLSAEFTQTSRVKLFKQELRSEGRLLYAREPETLAHPAAPQKKAATVRLRWEYLRPDPSTLLLVGDEAQLRMGNRPPQIFDMARDKNLGAIFAQLKLWLGLAGGANTASALQADYALGTGADKNHPALLLFPKPQSLLGKTFARVELHLSERTYELVRLLLVEQSGDEKEIVFTRIARNPKLPASAFAL